MKMDKVNTVEAKPSYDARLSYYDTLEIFLKSYAQAKIEADLNTQMRSLSGIYTLCSPYIKKEFREELEVLLNQIQNNINLNNPAAHNAASIKINNFALKIFDYGKHLFLPQGMDESIEPDWDAFVED